MNTELRERWCAVLKAKLALDAALVKIEKEHALTLDESIEVVEYQLQLYRAAKKIIDAEPEAVSDSEWKTPAREGV